MTLDWIDRAFAGRVAAPTPAPPGPSLPESGSSPALTERTPVIERLLDAAPSEWDGLADAVEEAARNGRRVVAVTGGRRGEGRSTVVAGIEAVLRRRGRSVIVSNKAPFLQAVADAHAARAADIVLVDAGPWFASGPIRRASVERAALGCDGVIVVRRADAPPCPAWHAALGMVGVTVIGEALTFVATAAED